MCPDEDEVPAALDTWCGVSRSLERAQAERLASALDSVWLAQREAVKAKDDQAVSRAWFDPLARGGRLREALDALPQAGDIFDGWEELELPDALAIDAGHGRAIVTREGRALAELLRRQLDSSPEAVRVRLPWSDTDAIDRKLLEEYRAAALSKLRSVVSLRTGAAAPLLPQAIGQVLLLVLNGNFGRGRGLERPSRPADREAVDEAVAAMVSRFAEEISPSRRGRAKGAYSLYSGYAMSEARRRLGTDLTTDPISLVAGSRARVLERLIDDLKRRGISRREALAALESLIEEYERWRPSLANYGLAQGSTTDRAALRRAFAAGFDEGS